MIAMRHAEHVEAPADDHIVLVRPPESHEAITSTIGRLVETWCLERGVEFRPVGSWTLESKEAARGVEPDECYVFGEGVMPTRPDLAIEAIWTSGEEVASLLDRPTTSQAIREYRARLAGR
jgi:Uma2 family endonuclease